MNRVFLSLFGAFFVATSAAAQGPVPTPRSVTGLDVGADRVLADWSQITGYFSALARSTPAVRVDTLGPTTEGRPLIVATISTPENMRRIADIRALQQVLADPRRLSAADEARAVTGQPAVVVISCNIHATEIGSSQMAMELAQRLATNDTLQSYLRNVVVLLVPSMNPDGENMVTEWYRRGVGTQWEGGPLPWLYHHYVGHDNNRDWYMITQAETKAVSRMLYQQWFPEIFYDVHQQGTNGMRITVPPHIDPIDPYVDPLIVRGISQIGAQMSWALEERGKTGVGDRQTYDLWWHGGARSAPTRHNMIGLLTEAASARVASPLTLTAEELQGRGGGQRLERRVSFPNPWPGGTWRLRDIMDYEQIAAEALVKLASDQRGEYVRNFVALGRKSIAAGGQAPYAYRVSPGPDPEATRRLLEALRWGGVEMGTTPGSADVFIPLAQPYRAHVMDLFEAQRYPRMERYPGGPVEPPYDVTGWTLPYQMNVPVARIDTALTAHLTPITAMTPELPGACPAPGGGRYVVLDASDTRSYGLVAQALRAGREVRASGRGAAARFTTAAPVTTTRGCAPRHVASMPAGSRLTRLPRIALYRSWTASMDEGWTRFLLEQEKIPFTALTDSVVKGGKLRDQYDVILVPDMSFREIHDGMSASQVPPQYAGGLGDRGVAELAAFVRSGGTLVLLDRASELATSALGVPVRRITVPRQDDENARGGGGSSGAATLYAPGSILRVLVDSASFVARGVGDTAAVYFTNSVTFDVADGSPVRVIARYPAREQDILLSGYLQGGTAIAGKAAAVDAPVGRGRVVMFGFRAQYRGQSYGTFKMMFNALLGEGDSTTRR